jgi:hypothetical protein
LSESNLVGERSIGTCINTCEMFVFSKLLWM